VDEAAIGSVVDAFEQPIAKVGELGRLSGKDSSGRKLEYCDKKRWIWSKRS
jgi:hypothetical protein